MKTQGGAGMPDIESDTMSSDLSTQEGIPVKTMKPKRERLPMKLRWLVVTFAILMPAFAQQPPSVYDLEQSFWLALEHNDLVALRSMMTEDYLSVEDGVSTRDEVITNLSGCKLNKFTLSDRRQRTISASSLLTVYRVTEDATCGDKHYAGTFIATTVWVLRDGHWLAQVHTEHPIEGKP